MAPATPTVIAAPGLVRRSLGRLRALLAAPEQGWVSLLLVLVLLWLAGSAVDDALATAPAGPGRTGFIPAMTVLAGLCGFILARLRLSIGWVDLLAAVVGAVAVLIAVSGAISTAASLEQRLRDLNTSLVVFVQQMSSADASTTEVSAGLLAVAAVTWTTGAFASLSVFRRSTATPAVAASAVLLLVGLLSTTRARAGAAPTDWSVVIFAGAAILLALRLNLTRQREAWGRRHIADGRNVGSLFLRGGVVLVIIALAGAVALATVASAAPLAPTWRDIGDQLQQVALDLQQVLGRIDGPSGRSSISFGPTQPINGVWVASDDVVFEATTSDGRGYKWRAVTYDRFDGTTWGQSDAAKGDIPANGPLLQYSSEVPPSAADTFRQMQATIDVKKADMGQRLLAPEVAVAVDRDAQVDTLGASGPWTMTELRDDAVAGDTIHVDALVRRLDPRQGGLSGNELAAAGQVYPSWIDAYREVRPDSIGSATRSAAAAIAAKLGDLRDPYHLTVAIQAFLHDTGDFVYSTDVSRLCPASMPIPDCLLTYKKGYCQYFATTMVMMLRDLGVPARYVQGFLPGQLDPSGSWIVKASAAHAWVEVWFPTFGWVPFDPTPGNAINGQEPTLLPPGPPVATPAPSGAPQASAVLPVQPPPDQASGDPTDVVSATLDLVPVGMAVVLGSLLVALVIALVIGAVRLRRFPGEPELAFRGIASLAARFGHGPRPAQTAYEYTAALGDVVPGMRHELEVVAHARVESVYGRRSPRGPALVALRHAYRRARVGLLQLVLRRGR